MVGLLEQAKMEDFDRRGRGRGLEISSLHRKSSQEAQQLQREKDLNGYQQLGVGWSRTTLLSPQCPPSPLDDHPLMMPQRRNQEDSQLHPQPWPQQSQKITFPQIYPLWHWRPSIIMIYILQARLFSVSGVDTQIPSQNITLPLLSSLEAPLVQRQETLIWFFPMLDLTMSQTRIYRINPLPQHLLMS